MMFAAWRYRQLSIPGIKHMPTNCQSTEQTTIMLECRNGTLQWIKKRMYVCVTPDGRTYTIWEDDGPPHDTGAACSIASIKSTPTDLYQEGESGNVQRLFLFEAQGISPPDGGSGRWTDWVDT